MIFDWADVAAVGLAMRDIANEDDGYTPSAKTASYTVEARYAHHVATASALREAYEAGTNESTQEAYDAGHEDGRSEAEHAYGPVMSVTVTRTSGDIEGDKRTYLPFKIEKPCECGGTLRTDLNDDYLSYPEWGIEYYLPITLYCQCDASVQVFVTPDVTLTVREP